MRYTTYAMIIVFLVAGCATSVMAEGSGSWWWPFGDQQREEGSTSATPTAPQQPKEDKPWMFSSPLANVSWPEFNLPHYELHVPHPKLPKPRLWPSKDETDQVRNAWAKPTGEPERASPWQVVTDGAHRLSTSTRNAWHKTVDVINPFDKPDTSVAQHQSRPSFWSNLFRVENDRPQGARTITEWMAQERLDP